MFIKKNVIINFLDKINALKIIKMQIVPQLLSTLFQVLSLFTSFYSIYYLSRLRYI